jgi:hypothetical protein
MNPIIKIGQGDSSIALLLPYVIKLHIERATLMIFALKMGHWGCYKSPTRQRAIGLSPRINQYTSLARRASIAHFQCEDQ